MAHFRIEFVLDQATGKYLAEMYHPDNQDELLVRTEALYPSQAAAVLGVVQLFKNAILKFPPADAAPRKIGKPKRARKKLKSAARRPAKRKPARAKKRR
jgi:hypothetical protein